jgi:excinuclease UvrABC nuclease subunit
VNRLTDREYVAGLKSNFHATFDSPQGKEVMRFLEQTCCWYRSVWEPSIPDLTLINDGKRQVVATIKTILECSPDQIVELAKQKEE